jgi:hypothetical protein
MLLGTRDPELHVSFTRGETVGLTISSLAGTASAIAAVVILVLIFVGIIINHPNLALSDALHSVAYVGRGTWKRWIFLWCVPATPTLSR